MKSAVKLIIPDAHRMEREFNAHHELSRDDAGFEKLAALLNGLAGIHLPPNEKNRMLMAGRVAPLLRKYGLEGYEELYRRLASGADFSLTSEFICSMTTNTTEFFRENAHFDFLQRQALPELLALKQKAGSRELRVWCAAASTGQEPYSILMTLLEALPNPEAWDFRFLASDIDHDVLERGAEGFYTSAESKNIPPLLRQKYFDSWSRGRRGNRDQETGYRIKRRFAQMIRFAPLNLLMEPYPFQHPFDIVFCRNVLIYFERDAAVRVVSRMTQSLRPGGYLFLGHSEVLAGRTSLTESVSHAVYRRRQGKERA